MIEDEDVGEKMQGKQGRVQQSSRNLYAIKADKGVFGERKEKGR